MCLLSLFNIGSQLRHNKDVKNVVLLILKMGEIHDKEKVSIDPTDKSRKIKRFIRYKLLRDSYDLFICLLGIL